MAAQSRWRRRSLQKCLTSLVHLTLVRAEAALDRILLKIQAAICPLLLGGPTALEEARLLRQRSATMQRTFRLFESFCLSRKAAVKQLDTLYTEHYKQDSVFLHNL